MRFLLTLILLAALGWSGYWFDRLSRALRPQLRNMVRRAPVRRLGSRLQRSERSGAFPTASTQAFSDIALADPETGLAWQAPFFQILALSYQPNHVIAVWPR